MNIRINTRDAPIANDEHVALLKQGVDAWNAWRGENRNIHADLGEANLAGANLAKHELTAANVKTVERKLSQDELRAQLPQNNEVNYIYLAPVTIIESRVVGEIPREQVTGANLSGANLSGADLSDAYLSGADLREADLREADLTKANLYQANFSGANLREANLNGANLSGADLSDAYLSGADLREAILTSELRRTNTTKKRVS